MELEEMKTAWKELDERLCKHEILEEKCIKEYIVARSQSSANKFLNFEVAGAAVLLMVMPFVICRYGMPWVGNYPGMKAFLLFALVLLPLIFVWQLIKIWLLYRIDMSKNVRYNIVNVRRYELCVMAEKRIMIVLSLLMLIVVVALRAMWGTPPWIWALLVGAVIICILFVIWYYKKFYANNMGAIKRGLEEFKDPLNNKGLIP